MVLNDEFIGYVLILLAAVVLVLSIGSSIALPTNEESTHTNFDPPVPSEYSFPLPTAEGVAVVNGDEYGSVQRAVSVAEPGDVVSLRGSFNERVVIDTPNLTIASMPGELALVNGSGKGDVITVNASNVTLEHVWVRNSGYNTSTNDAAVWLNGSDSKVVDSRITEATFGVWINGVDGVMVANNTIVGRERITPLSYRGNGIQVWKTENSLIKNNRVTDVRDGIYYSWASEVIARDNVFWDLRYGVHYMYSDNCRLTENLAFGNDVGYALMVSQQLNITGNVAVNNSGGSGHGILVKSIDSSRISKNTLVRNKRGFYVYNSLENTITNNLVLNNDLGVYLAAGSVREDVYNNSFIYNGEPLTAVMNEQVTWNSSRRGNYWSGARTLDRDRDGVSEIRYRPTDLVDYVTQKHPQARVYSHSPAFDAIQLAENSFPVIRSPGVIDYHPLMEPPHKDWRKYYGKQGRDS